MFNSHHHNQNNSVFFTELLFLKPVVLLMFRIKFDSVLLSEGLIFVRLLFSGCSSNSWLEGDSFVLSVSHHWVVQVSKAIPEAERGASGG